MCLNPNDVGRLLNKKIVTLFKKKSRILRDGTSNYTDYNCVDMVERIHITNVRYRKMRGWKSDKQKFLSLYNSEKVET